MNPSLPHDYSQKSPPPSAPPPPQPYHQPPPAPPQYGQYATGVLGQYNQVNLTVNPMTPSPGYVNWSSSLCGCSSDVTNCWTTCLCPCITFGQIAEIIDKGNTSCGVHGVLYALIAVFTCCGCMYSCTHRTKMRSQYGLRESPCNDCLVHCFCEMCALCQEYRELKNRGIDVSIGWEGNMERRNQGVHLPPMAPGGMYR